jgi:predicted nucleotidyltransferase
MNRLQNKTKVNNKKSSDWDYGSYPINTIKYLKTLQPKEVVNFFQILQENFCPHCGYENLGQSFYCTEIGPLQNAVLEY